MVTHRIEYVTIHLSASLQRTASFLGFVCAHPIDPTQSSSGLLLRLSSKLGSAN
jgi:hypothetical protein